MTEKEAVVRADVSVWVDVCCSECGEPLEFEVESTAGKDTLTIQVEPHQCEEEEA